MTYREKLKKEHPERVYESAKGGCEGCPYSYGYERFNSCFITKDGNKDCRACWDREIPEEKPKGHDPVNHPSHYCREGAMESIDEMCLIFGDEAVMHFCLCNAWKYRYRAADKNGAEDMAKSDWYIKKYKELKR